ncbi:MAG: molybdopterin-dependent oxidoreductase [Peptococcaceae bacterium]
MQQIKQIGDLFAKLFSDEDIANQKGREFKYCAEGSTLLNGICRMCMQGDCLTKVTVKDGIIVKIEGNPDSPTGAGQLCPRGNASILNIYNPYRIKRPLQRINPERGLEVDPQWIEISWEEALEKTARELKNVLQDDPRGLIVCEGFGIRDTYVRTPFVKAFGTPNLVGGAHGVLCSVHLATNLVQAGHPVAIPDLEYCNYHITIGRSNGANFATTPGIRRFAEAVSRGMKLVVVDPRCSPEASKGEWVPIKPGTDLAFVLALAYVMFYEIEKYDEWFIKSRTNAPYLINEEGWYVRSDRNAKPLVWQNNLNKAVVFEQADSHDLALFGTFEVNGQKCKPAFQVIREGFASYTPEWAEKVCDVPAAVIRRIADEFVKAACIGQKITIDGFEFPYRPVSLNCERGCTDHQGGTYADLTTKIINLLVGAIEVPGGCLSAGGRGPFLKPDENGTVTPAYEAVGVPFKFPPEHIDMAEFYPHRHTAPQMAVRAILDPQKYHLQYQARIWFTIGGNPIRRTAEPQIYVDALKQIPFLCSIAYHADEPTWLSDIVFPEDSFLERDSLRNFQPQHQTTANEVNGLRMIMARETVPRLFSTKNCDDILLELAERTGILYGPGGVNDYLNQHRDKVLLEDGLIFKPPYLLKLDQKYSVTELYDHLSRSYFDCTAKDYAYVQSKGFIPQRLLYKECYNYYYFPDDKTRHPIYFERLKMTGRQLYEGCAKNGVKVPGWDNMDEVMMYYQPVPRWIPNSEFFEDGEYPLYAINWKTAYFTNAVGVPHLNPLIQALANDIDPYENVIWINRRTAEKYQLKDWQEVRVISRYGYMDGILKVTELIHPRVLGIPGGHGAGRMSEQTNFNSLLTTDDRTVDAVNVSIEVSPRVKLVSKRGV